MKTDQAVYSCVYRRALFKGVHKVSRYVFFLYVELTINVSGIFVKIRNSININS